jgi:hypothetical protein
VLTSEEDTSVDWLAEVQPEVASRSLSFGILTVRRWAVEVGRTVALAGVLGLDEEVGAGGLLDRDAEVADREDLDLD